jgi:hypothetical protein
MSELSFGLEPSNFFESPIVMSYLKTALSLKYYYIYNKKKETKASR